MSLPPEATDILERGYAVFEGACPPDELATLRAAVEDLVAELQPEQMQEPQQRALSDWAAVTPSGLALHGALHRRPDLAGIVFRPRVVETVRALLGDDARVEVTGAMVSDRQRPFFEWHTHIGGEDEGERVRRGEWPRVDSVRRILTLMYLDALDDEGGLLQLLPRRVGDPTEPPGDLSAPEWSGQVQIRAEPGSLVALEQCTWHAAHSKRGPGTRAIWACYYAAADEPCSGRFDPSLRDVPATDPLFRSLMAGSAPG